MLVLKVGGNEIDDPDFVKQLGKVLVSLQEPMLLVHGGGKEIKQLQERLGFEAQYIDGLRVTDEESLALVEMVLAGRVNKRLVASLSNAGLDAFGMSGIDRASIQAEKLEHPNGDLGHVGKITHVKADVFRHLIDDNVVPILSPICYGPGGHIFNVNADHVALAVAVALEATQLVFLTNVPGVLHNEALLPALAAAEVESLIREEVIVGGMIPKVKSALQAVAGGVKAVRITNLVGLQQGSGTVITAQTTMEPPTSAKKPRNNIQKITEPEIKQS